ncbi:hypothetical protein ABPG72_011394 [Tetrahymena utriculariae]
MFKLQSKNENNYQNNLWKIPFEYEDRYNTHDYIESQQSTQLVCIVYQDPQTVITFDFNFIYSVCPTDIIIYNRLSFQQQFPVINYEIKEAVNMIGINYNNYFLIIQKEQIYLIQLQYNSTYKIIFQKQKRYYQVQVLQLIKIQAGYNLQLVLSSQSDIERIVIPLSPNDICNLNIQQHNSLIDRNWLQWSSNSKVILKIFSPILQHIAPSCYCSIRRSFPFHCVAHLLMNN